MIKPLLTKPGLADFTTVMTVLDEYGAAVRDAYRDSLARNGRPASGNLMNTVEYTVDRNGAQFTVTLNLASYWKYVENGTRPHWPPPSRILEWIDIKPVIPRPDRNGRIPSPKSLAFLISRKISREGTTGTYDLRDALTDINGKYRERIAEALNTDLSNVMAAFAAGLGGNG